MTVTTTRASFQSCERYFFDFTLCTYAKGWMQIDTYQDASYFGIWTRPTSLEVITFAEGDFVHVECETFAEYTREIASIVRAYSNDEWHCRIDRHIYPATHPAMTVLSHCGLMSYVH